MDFSEINKKLENLRTSSIKMQVAWMKFQEALEETRRITEELARLDGEESYISKDGRLHWSNSDDVAEFGEKISGGPSEDREPGGDA